MKLTDHFERVSILSLPQNSHRRERLFKQFEDLELVDFDRTLWINAISGQKCPAPGHFRAGDGAWGCLQTHSHAVQDAAMDNITSCLILEDDAVFHPKSRLLLDKFLPEIPADWDQIYLGGQFLKEPEQIGQNSIVLRGMNVNRAHAYGLHRRVYQRFLQHIHYAPDYLERENWHMDHQLGLAHERRLWNTYCPSWWMVGQASGKSDIAGRINQEFWWHQSKYARRLPFIHIPKNIIDSCDVRLLKHIHFGWNLKRDTCIDADLDQVATGYKGLGEWMDKVAKEAIDLYQIPGLCHPSISIENMRLQWPTVLGFSEGLDFELMCHYPSNGLFEHPMFC